MRYSCGAHTTNLCLCHNVWCTLNASWWLVLQVQSWTCETLHVLCNHSVPEYNFWCTEWFFCVKWNWTYSQCGGQSCHSESLTCDIGLVERKVCSGLLRLPFSVSSPKPCALQSLCELSTLNWCCNSVYNGKLTILCVEFSCIQVSDLKPITFRRNFFH